MSWAPIDSTEARELAELDQELPAAVTPPDVAHDLQCRKGWLGEDAAGRPVPCLRCRPHLARAAICSTCRTPAPACADQVHQRRGRCCEDCQHPGLGRAEVRR